MNVKDVFFSNLFLPIISFLLIIGMVMVNAKGKILQQKTLVFFILVSSVIMAVPAMFALAGGNFIPEFYIVIQFLFLLAGYFYLVKCENIFTGKYQSINKIMIVMASLAILCLGTYLFSTVFNLVSEFDYGLFASTSTYTFLIPTFLKWSYTSLLNIPGSIFKVWRYNPAYDEPVFTSETIDKIVVLELELRKNTQDKDLIKVKAKAPVHFTFGTWFQMFLHDYNMKYHSSPISYEFKNGEMYGWIFYAKPSMLKEKTYIDFEKTIEENGLAEGVAEIVCKRVENIYENNTAIL